MELPYHVKKMLTILQQHHIKVDNCKKACCPICALLLLSSRTISHYYFIYLCYV